MWMSRSLTVFSFVLGLALVGCDDENLNHIPQPGAISGQVCDPADARGIAGARVFVVVGEGELATTVETTTDGDGHFTLERVPPGEHTLYVQRGSFRSEVPAVLVEEETETTLDPAACIAPDEVTMLVYDGHDSVEEVLERLGYDGFTVVDTHHEWEERTDQTPSWLVEAFSSPHALDGVDIVFINCAAHEWAVDRASDAELETVLTNLRRFVAEGGSVYLSDWSYDLLELLYPDAVDWAHDDTEPNAAEVGLSQSFLADVVDDDLSSFLELGEVLLNYELGRIAMPRTLGPGSRALLTATVQAEGEAEDEPLTYTQVPVLLEHRPEVLGVPEEEVGRVIFTTFHNGNNNTRDMDEVLRAIVYSL